MDVGVEDFRFEYNRGRGEWIIGTASNGEFEDAPLVGCIDGTFYKGSPVQEGGRGRRAEVDVLREGKARNEKDNNENKKNHYYTTPRLLNIQ